MTKSATASEKKNASSKSKPKGRTLGKSRPAVGGLWSKSLLELALEHAARVPDEALVDVPTDGASNLDHYLYGAGRRS